MVCGAGGLDLDVLNVGLFAGVGAAAGELVGYAIGYGGQGIVERRRFYLTLKYWMERRGALLLFVASALPNPLFDLVGVAAGSTRYPVERFMLAVGVRQHRQARSRGLGVQPGVRPAPVGVLGRSFPRMLVTWSGAALYAPKSGC